MTGMATATHDPPAGMSAWIVRAMLLVAALFLLWWAQEAFGAFERVSATRSRYDRGDLVSVVVLFAAAGLGFGLAIRFPFPEPRFAWGRLLFAAVALIPATHLWLLLAGSAGVLGRAYWFDGFTMVQIGAVLAGVSVASGVGARPARP